jgi:hypothetical protein
MKKAPKTIKKSLNNTMLVVAVFATASCGGGGAGGSTTPSSGNPAIVAQEPALTEALRLPPNYNTGWSRNLKAVLDANGVLHLAGFVDSQDGAGRLTTYTKRSTGGAWSPIITAVDTLPNRFDEPSPALSTNANGAAALMVGGGGVSVVQFISPAGMLLGRVSRSQIAAGQPDLTLLDDGSAVFSATETKSTIDTTPVTRIFRATSAGDNTTVAGSEPAYLGPTYFIPRIKSAVDGYLINLTSVNGDLANRQFLGSRSGSGTPFVFLGQSVNESLAYSSSNITGCLNSEVSLLPSPVGDGKFAGVMRVIETNNGVRVCALRFFRNISGANLSQVNIPVTSPGQVAFRRGVTLPTAYVDSAGRSTIVWSKGTGQQQGDSIDAAIEATSISNSNEVSAPTIVAQSSATFGTIIESQVSFSQNASGVGALAFLVRPPSTSPRPLSLYVSKYSHQSGFSKPVQVASVANSDLVGVTAVIDAGGNANVIASGKDCGQLVLNPQGYSCGNGPLALYSYRF